MDLLCWRFTGKGGPLKAEEFVDDLAKKAKEIKFLIIKKNKNVIL